MHHIGDLAEVLDNLGVFGLHPEDVIAPCPSGFRRVPINEGGDSYLSLQGFAPSQIAYAHTPPIPRNGWWSFAEPARRSCPRSPSRSPA